MQGCVSLYSAIHLQINTGGGVSPKIGGIATRIIGRTEQADATLPSTMKKIVKTSNEVVGSKSSAIPTSAENLFRILPCERV